MPFVFPLGQIPSINVHFKKVAYNASKHLLIARIYCKNTIDGKKNPNNQMHNF
jgi:hypothetical protein